MMRTGTRAVVLALFAALLAGPATAADEKDEAKDDLKTLREEIDKLKKDMARDRRQLNDRLDRIEQAIENLNGKTRTRTSSSFTPRADDTGTLRLDNRMAVEAAVTVDGVTYRVPPLSTRTLRDRPAGAFDYTVTGAGMGTARRRSVLGRNERLTVTITPPVVRLLDE